MAEHPPSEQRVIDNAKIRNYDAQLLLGAKPKSTRSNEQPAGPSSDGLGGSSTNLRNPHQPQPGARSASAANDGNGDDGFSSVLNSMRAIDSTSASAAGASINNPQQSDLRRRSPSIISSINKAVLALDRYGMNSVEHCVSQLGIAAEKVAEASFKDLLQTVHGLLDHSREALERAHTQLQAAFATWRVIARSTPSHADITESLRGAIQAQERFLRYVKTALQAIDAFVKGEQFVSGMEEDSEDDIAV